MPNILVIDDDRNMAEVIAIMLEYEMGHNAITAFSGYDAMARLREIDIGIVITDLKMPGMDGFALIELMRKRGLHIPTIVITAFHTLAEQEKAEQLHVFAYLTRPFDNDDLKEIIHRALEHQGQLRDQSSGG